MNESKICSCVSCYDVLCASYHDEFCERTSHAEGLLLTDATYDDPFFVVYAAYGVSFRASYRTYGSAFCVGLFYVSYASYDAVRDVQASCMAKPLQALACYPAFHGGGVVSDAAFRVGGPLFETYGGKPSCEGVIDFRFRLNSKKKMMIACDVSCYGAFHDAFCGTLVAFCDAYDDPSHAVQACDEYGDPSHVA